MGRASAEPSSIAIKPAKPAKTGDLSIQFLMREALRRQHSSAVRPE